MDMFRDVSVGTDDGKIIILPNAGVCKSLWDETTDTHGGANLVSNTLVPELCLLIIKCSHGVDALR